MLHLVLCMKCDLTIKNCHLFQDDSIINSEDKSIYRLWNISMSMVIFSSRSVKTFWSR